MGFRIQLPFSRKNYVKDQGCRDSLLLVEGTNITLVELWRIICSEIYFVPTSKSNDCGGSIETAKPEAPLLGADPQFLWCCVSIFPYCSVMVDQQVPVPARSYVLKMVWLEPWSCSSCFLETGWHPTWQDSIEDNSLPGSASCQRSVCEILVTPWVFSAHGCWRAPTQRQSLVSKMSKGMTDLEMIVQNLTSTLCILHIGIHAHGRFCLCVCVYISVTAQHLASPSFSLLTSCHHIHILLLFSATLPLHSGSVCNPFIVTVVWHWQCVRGQASASWKKCLRS